MARKKGSPGSLRNELVCKAREAALAAIRVYNDPTMRFKSEAFIVLMVIAWTYLLHAHYRSKGIDYRYFVLHNGRKRFDRTTRRSYKYWELERCLAEATCPLDRDTINNLRFLIGLRHEIEHQMTRALDGFLSGRYQACALNFNHFIKQLVGSKDSLDQHLGYSIQFLQLSQEQLAQPPAEPEIPERLKAYVAEFDSGLTHDEYNSERFAYRLLFKRKLVNRPGQADKVIEFIDPNSELARTIDKEYWVKKEVEKQKYRATHVVAAVRKAGFAGYKMFPHHLTMWKTANAKEPGKGFGCDVQGTWYWYQSWVDRCVELCTAAGDKFKATASA